MRKTNDKEWNLLIHLCSQAFNPKKITTIPSSFNEVDKEILLQLARQHQIIPMLYQGIINWDEKDFFSNTFITRLKAINLQITTHNLQHLKELLNLIKLLKKEGIEIIPLKGLVLAQEAYGSINARSFSDIDFLFRLEDLVGIKKVLTSMDYQLMDDRPKVIEQQFLHYNCEFSFIRFQNGKRLFHVEPHWFIGHRMFQMNLDFNEIIELTTIETHYQTPINTLTPTGLLLTTCLHHNGKDQMKLLKQVYDVAAILYKFEKDIDWSLFLSKIKAWKVENLVLIGIGIAQRFCKVNLPSNIQQKLLDKKLEQQIQLSTNRLVSTALGITTKSVSSNSAIFDHLWFHVKLRKHWRTKLQIIYYGLLHTVTPNIIDLKGKNVSKLEFYWLALKKPFRLLKKDSEQ